MRFGKYTRKYSLGSTALLLLLVAPLAGCQHRAINASALPPEFMAPPVTNYRQVDLTRLARPGGGSERIHSGDLLEISVVTGIREVDPDAWLLQVSDNGTIDVPLIGPVPVAGLDLPTASVAIRNASGHRQVYLNPRVTVQFKRRYAHKVTVMGAVAEPGVYELPAANSDLVAALVAAGGLTEDADTVVELRHPSADQDPSLLGSRPPAGDTVLTAFQGPPGATGPTQLQTQRIDLLAAAANLPGGLQLADGSVVMVRTKRNRIIYVMGLVNQPDQFEMPVDADLRLIDALAMAGGRSFQIADKTSIIRQHPNGGSVTIAASVREAQRSGSANIRLAPGDVVKVEQTPATFTVGMLKSLMRFGFSTAIPGT